MLSPNSSGQTVLLLQQISQQLSDSSNYTYVNPQEYLSFSPSTSIVCVNAMWVLSLILSIACALLATLMQQWARQYVQLPKLPAIPRERANVRSFLFFGLQQFGMSYAVELIPTLLHLSVFLFFAGLVIFFFTYSRAVAIITSISVGVFSIAYIALTLLPCVYLNCPYRAPLSNLSWYVWHTVTHHIMALTLWVEEIFHATGHLVEWRNTFEHYMQDRDRRLKAGLSRSVVDRAQSDPEDRELQALNWFIHAPALSEDSAFQDFVSTLTCDKIRRMLQPSGPNPSTAFGDRLHNLLRTCLPGTTGLTEHPRKHRLLTCLDAIYQGFRAYNLEESEECIPNSIRVNFAELRILRALWSDEDTAVRVRARCISALLARRILRDIGGPTPRRSTRDGDISWLEAVFGESGPSSNKIYNSLQDLNELDSMNLNSFVRGVKSPLVAGRLTNKELTSILDTLTILMDAKDTSHRISLQDRIQVLTQRAETSGFLQQLVTPLLEFLREAFPIDMVSSPTLSIPMPIPVTMPRPHS